MSWIGMAMYVGFALGGPLGAALYAWGGFGAIAATTIAVPACAWLGVLRLQGPAKLEDGGRQAPQQKVLGAVRLPGVALALASLGFGTLTTFAPLLLSERHWGSTWTAFSAFSLAFALARLFLGHLPDRLSGAKVAVVCVLVEGAGQGLVWQAGGLPAMLAGSVLTGLGYALVYPALGVEAVRRAPAASRALAMGAYTAFLDLMLGVGSPVLGLVAGHAGVQAVFAVGAGAAVCSALPAALLATGARKQPVSPAA
jgi:MFS family permease